MDDFAKWDCPGAYACQRQREKPSKSDDLFPCADCKAPRRIIRESDGAIVYRSYSDYVG